MTEPRLVQNFRDTRATIVACPGAQLGGLAPTLERLGLVIGTVRPEALAALLPGLHEDRDILLIDGDLAEPVVMPGIVPVMPPAPVIGLVGVEAPGRLRALMGLGATALLRKPVHTASVYSALYLGVNEHRRQRALQRRMDRQEARLRGRRHVIRAVVHLAVRHGLDEDAAFALLRRESMRARQSLEEYCDQWVGGGCPHLPGSPRSENPHTENLEAHHA